MKVKTTIKAGAVNHNETLVRGLKVRTNVKAGAVNHNETLVRGSSWKMESR
jgi:hypothetical protein